MSKCDTLIFFMRTLDQVSHCDVESSYMAHGLKTGVPTAIFETTFTSYEMDPKMAQFKTGSKNGLCMSQQFWAIFEVYLVKCSFIGSIAVRLKFLKC